MIFKLTADEYTTVVACLRMVGQELPAGSAAECRRLADRLEADAKLQGRDDEQ